MKGSSLLVAPGNRNGAGGGEGGGGGLCGWLEGTPGGYIGRGFAGQLSVPSGGPLLLQMFSSVQMHALVFSFLDS